MKTKKEIKLFLIVEKKELQKFTRISKDVLHEMEKTRKELKLEEQINLNLNFIHYKMNELHKVIDRLIEFDREKKKGKDLNIEIKITTNQVLEHIFELESDFFPVIRNNIKILVETEGSTTSFAKEIMDKFNSYKGMVDSLKGAINVEEIKDLRKIPSKNINVEIH